MWRILLFMLLFRALNSSGQFRQEVTIGTQVGTLLNFPSLFSMGFEEKAQYRCSPVGSIYAEVPFERHFGLRASWGYGLYNYKQTYPDEESTKTFLKASVLDWDLQLMSKYKHWDIYMGFKAKTFYGVKRYNWIDGKRYIRKHPDIKDWNFFVTAGWTYKFKPWVGIFLKFDFEMPQIRDPYFSGLGRDLKFDGLCFGMQFRIARIPFRRFYHSPYEKY